jgi:hypothetical protein
MVINNAAIPLKILPYYVSAAIALWKTQKVSKTLYLYLSFIYVCAISDKKSSIFIHLPDIYLFNLMLRILLNSDAPSALYVFNELTLRKSTPNTSARNHGSDTSHMHQQCRC